MIWYVIRLVSSSEYDYQTKRESQQVKVYFTSWHLLKKGLYLSSEMSWFALYLSRRRTDTLTWRMSLLLQCSTINLRIFLLLRYF
jgi:hypothetical protein